jgi:putative flippase GtrA
VKELTSEDTIGSKGGIPRLEPIPIRAGVDTLLISNLSKMPVFRFLFVGGAAFLLDAAIVWGLTHFGSNAYLARSISLAISIGFTFLANRSLTFSASGPILWQEVSAYIGASLLGLAINYGLYVGLLKLNYHWLPAMIGGTLVASVFNFLVYKRIFKKPNENS